MFIKSLVYYKIDLWHLLNFVEIHIMAVFYIFINVKKIKCSSMIGGRKNIKQ